MSGEAVANLTMAELITSLQAVFTQVVTNIGTIVTTITSNPWLLLTSGLMFAGAMFGFLRRLLRSY